jgi:LysM repeat protein
MRHFYHRLEQLAEGKIRTVNIVHIGDSHIQADWFSGQTRVELQRRFGSAGRGLVFPYSVARTNSPNDIHSTSSANWEIQRNVTSNPKLPTGISGITLRTHSPDFGLNLRIDDGPYGLDYSFNKVTLFTGKSSDHFDLLASTQPFDASRSAAEEKTWHTVASGETLSGIAGKFGTTVAGLKQLNGLSGEQIAAGQRLIIRWADGTETTQPRIFPITLAARAINDFTTTVYLPETTHALYLRARPTSGLQEQATLFGLVLENYNRSGILYHMIGVNGARYEHYAASDYFAEQLQALQPDLVIVSLGTNETVWGFNEERFFREVDQLVHRIEQYMPHAAIIFTTPPDAYKGGTEVNPAVNRCREVLLNYAFGNDLAAWDLYEVMGGTGSVNDWYAAGLAGRDRLHFTKSGYELQGKLLSQAIFLGYDTYRAGR